MAPDRSRSRCRGAFDEPAAVDGDDELVELQRARGDEDVDHARALCGHAHSCARGCVAELACDEHLWAGTRAAGCRGLGICALSFAPRYREHAKRRRGPRAIRLSHRDNDGVFPVLEARS